MIIYELLLLKVKYIFLPFLSLFNKKIKIILEEQRHIFKKLGSIPSTKKETVWFHIASAGEFLQVLPLIENFKKANYFIFLSHSSPSAISFLKKYPICDFTSYFPLDTKKNIKKLIQIVKPKMLVLVKYEIWPNLLIETYNAKIPSFLIAASAKNKKIFLYIFKNLYKKIKIIFTINKYDTESFKKFKLTNIITIGDTKVDYVRSRTLESLDPILEAQLSKIKICYNKTLILGSSWAKDETIVLKAWKKFSDKIFLIVAPHEPSLKHLDCLEKQIRILDLNSVRLSKCINLDSSKINVLIVDKVGILANLYKYADYAFVGSGAGGVHNILEPAVFNLPIMFRNKIKNSQEALYFRKNKIAKIINNHKELISYLTYDLGNDIQIKLISNKTKAYFEMNEGASDKISNNILEHSKKKP